VCWLVLGVPLNEGKPINPLEMGEGKNKRTYVNSQV
jgi:hypothetical protein